jgi:hypothetical protein
MAHISETEDQVIEQSKEGVAIEPNEATDEEIKAAPIDDLPERPIKK